MSDGKILRSSRRTFQTKRAANSGYYELLTMDETRVGWVSIIDFAFQDTYTKLYMLGEVDELAGLIKKIKRYHEIHSKH